MKHNVNLLAAAFALTAVSYGLARFAFGLLLPQIRTELSLDIGTTAGSAAARSSRIALACASPSW